MTTRNTTSNTYNENDVPSNQPHRLTPQQLEERRVKGICFNCDNKYNKGYSVEKIKYTTYNVTRKKKRAGTTIGG